MKKCRICHSQFVARFPMQATCENFECKVAYGEQVAAKAKRKREKVERANDRQRLQELKPIQYWLKRTERAVNAVVRERDSEQPCISCGTYDAAEWHAGHWKSVGANSALRFDYSNIHKQCDHCNVFKAGNATEYELRLPARIGVDEYMRLKHAPRIRKWTREECQAIEADAKLKLKALLSEKKECKTEEVLCE